MHGNLHGEVNLVPFIDLLSMSICFLLMTAVWVQLGSLEIKQSGTSDSRETSQRYELELSFTGSNSLNLETKINGKRKAFFHLQAQSLPKLMAKLDTTTHQVLAQVPHSSAPSVAAIAAMINPHPQASYGAMVAAMDTLRKNQIINLGVRPQIE